MYTLPLPPHVFFPFEPNWDTPIRTSLRYNVAIQRAADGGEKRRLLGNFLLRTIEYRVTTQSAEETAELKLWLKELGEDKVLMPNWPEYTLATEDFLPSYQVFVEALSKQDFDTGIPISGPAFDPQILAVYENFQRYEPFEILSTPSAGDTVFFISFDSSNEYPKGSRILPLMRGRIESLPEVSPHDNEKADVTIRFTQEEPDQARIYTPPTPTQYQSRPILELRPDSGGERETWQATIEHAQAGLGRPTPWDPGENYRVWRFRFTLEGYPAIRSLADFFEYVKGSEQGFWMPTWQNDLPLILDDTGSGITDFDIENIGLGTLHGTRDAYDWISFLTADGSIHPYEIESMSGDPTVDTITLTSSLTQSYSKSKDMVSWLLFVRFADLQFTWLTNTIAQAEVRVVELPREYATAETGASPVWLYELDDGTTVTRWTSFARELTAASNDYAPEDMNHGPITRSSDMLDEGPTVTIHTTDTDHPLWGFTDGMPPDTQFIMRIYQTTATSPDLSNKLFQGRITSISYPPGPRIEVKLSSLGGLGERQAVMPVVSKRCGVPLYGSACGLNSETFKTTGAVDALNASPPYVEASEFDTDATAAAGAGKVSDKDDWFPGGRVQVGTEQRLIIKADGDRLYINAPFRNASVTDTVYAWPGCDHTFPVCGTKFGNAVNYRFAAPWLPEINPQLEALQAQQPKKIGGKK